MKQKGILKSELENILNQVNIFASKLAPSLRDMEMCISKLQLTKENKEAQKDLEHRFEEFSEAIDYADKVSKLLEQALKNPVHDPSVTEDNIKELKVKRSSLRPSQTEKVEVRNIAGETSEGGKTDLKTRESDVNEHITLRRRGRITSIAEESEDGNPATPVGIKPSLENALDKQEALYNDLGVGRVSFVCQDMGVAHNMYNTEKREEREVEKRRRSVSMNFLPSRALAVGPTVLETGSQNQIQLPADIPGASYTSTGRRVSFSSTTQSPIMLQAFQRTTTSRF